MTLGAEDSAMTTDRERLRLVLVNLIGNARDADLDKTSFFRATVLFPGNMFVEYTDGQRPLDLQDESAVYLGFRYGKLQR